MRYFRFVSEHRAFLAFGASLTFASNFGQTFYVALFGAEMRREFGLSHGAFGALYSVATLASGVTLIWVGRKLDESDLRRYATGVCLGLVGACLLLAATPFAWCLVPAFFAIRFTGQGLMSHTAMSSMARYFETDRGRAMGVATLGRPIGESILPRITVALIAGIGWRLSWVVIAAVLAVSLLPFTRWLLRDHHERHRAHEERMRATSAGGSPARSRTQREVLKDPRFWIKLPCVLAAPFLLSGIFFHQIHIAETKGWTIKWYAACFTAYAITTVIATLVGGVLVDRFTARRLLPTLTLPMGVGFVTLAMSDSPVVAATFLGLSGATMGISFVVLGALWAEMYGVANVGAIRALTSAIIVFSTAAAPVLFGRLIDLGTTTETIAWMSAGWVAAAAALATIDVAIPQRAEAS